MSDLIDRQAAIDAMNEWEWQELYLPIHFKQLLEELPPVKQNKTCYKMCDRWKAKQKMGNWIYCYTNGFGRQILKCSKCSFRGDALGFKYCPYCGAKMQEVEE